MMKRIINLFSLFCILALCSCEKVIDLELKESDIKYVVEGVITNEPGSCKVYISQSRQFDEENQFPPVSGAVVTIKDNGKGFSPTDVQSTSLGMNIMHERAEAIDAAISAACVRREQER